MASNSDEYTPQQYRKYNGQSVFKALKAVGKEASADELANFIAEDIGVSEDYVLPEVKHVLRRGIINGFLVRTGKYYSFVGDDLEMQVDSTQRRRKTPTKKKTSPNTEVYDEEDEVSDEQESEEDESNEDENVRDEMQTDNPVAFRRPKVKLYERYHSYEYESDDEYESGHEQSEEENVDEPQPKRIRLQPNLNRIKKRN